ncbi:vacuolar amino acid transporter, putative [Perkinsus marinus ATCC 50983]|uniref:Vacuolar amino acid transporter, putative n=2 Tax=Perkinsus marinus (strain ATCC 50983 / TXsc) TaxID=423536 RepID=C5LWJ3_PERM5|nr:vacuolar amino acid transporter, putative [Perkinsus marinus ATCC 50983]EEQ98906.1 vacuolar amino acid transporter, putative [Perkinsus marinus ATCC 50983]|eukprot:XP_002766189.1 vacuolar amino acid transporter, putative [Perkinsus marinus ATCC 50983]
MSLTSLFKKNRTEESVTDPSGKSSGDVEMHVMDDSATAAMSPKSASSSADIQKQSNAAAEEVHGECSDIRGVFSVVLSAIGMGVVMLPTVFAACGWVGGFVCLILGALFAGFNVTKLYDGISLCPKSKGHVYTYEDLGKACYGRIGHFITALIVHITMSGICASLLVLLGETLQKLVPSVGQKGWVGIWAVIFVPFTFLKTMNEVSYVATCGMVAILVLFGVVAVNGIVTGVTADVAPKYDIFAPDFMTFATNFGVCILSFNVTNSVATLVRDMAKPTHFKGVAIAAYGIILTVYIGIGICGYYGYGDELKAHPIMDSIVPPDQPVHGVWGYLTEIAVICSSIPHYVVMLLPIASSLEYWCHIKVEDTTWKATIKRFIARLCCIAFTLLIAEVVPNIQSLINVLGSFTMVIMVAMMPCIFYVRVQQFVLGSVKKYVRKHVIETIVICIVLIWCIPMIVIGSIGAIEDFGES